MLYVVAGVGLWLARLRVRTPRHVGGRDPRAHGVRRDRCADASSSTKRRSSTCRPSRLPRRRRRSPASRCRSSSGWSTCSTRGRASSSCRCSRSRTPGSRSRRTTLSNAVTSRVTYGVRARARSSASSSVSSERRGSRLGCGSARCPQGASWRGIVGVGARRRDRVHRVDLRGRAGVRRGAAAGERGEDRDPRRVDRRGDDRLARPCPATTATSRRLSESRTNRSFDDRFSPR